MASVNVAVDITLTAASTKIPQFWDHKIILQEATRPQGQWNDLFKGRRSKKNTYHTYQTNYKVTLQSIHFSPCPGLPHVTTLAQVSPNLKFHSHCHSLQGLVKVAPCFIMLYSSLYSESQCFKTLKAWYLTFYSTWTGQNSARGPEQQKADETHNLCNLQDQQSLFKWWNLQPPSQ